MVNDDEADFVDQICESLPFESSCRVQHSQFTDRHAKKFSKILYHRLSTSRRASKLERLSFYRCPKLGVEGVVSILETLQKIQKLPSQEQALELEISSVRIEDRGLRAVCDFLFPQYTYDQEKRPLLKSLEIEEIGRCEQTTWNFFLHSVLKNDFRLETLDLTHTHLTLESLAILTKSLETNTCLQNLILSENPMIGNQGVKLLSKALQKNSTLKVLSLAVCNITDQGIQTLAQCVELYNTTLTKIYLFANPYNHNSEDKIKLSYWLELNAYGRDAIRAGATHRVLAKACRKQRPDLLYGLLQEAPHMWINS